MRGLVALMALAATNMAHAERVPFKIVKKDPRFHEALPPHATVTRIASGFTWVEGPLWSRDGYLLFTDIPANRVVMWAPGRGTRDFLTAAGYTGKAPFSGFEPGANGLAWDAEGRLLLAQHGDRRIARLEPDGSFTTIAAHVGERRFNSPNDLVVRANGDLYFTDPPFGLPRAFDDERREIPYSGIYRVDRSGRVTLLTRALDAPNGLAFSPDERTLYVTNADPEKAQVWAFPLRADGTLEEGRVLIDMTARARELARRKVRTGNPDGIKTDRAGRIWIAGPGGLHVFTAEGTELGGIEAAFPISNLAFGGGALYLTADTEVYRVSPVAP